MLLKEFSEIPIYEKKKKLTSKMSLKLIYNAQKNF